jgi:hypothetical protein
MSGRAAENGLNGSTYEELLTHRRCRRWSVSTRPSSTANSTNGKTVKKRALLDHDLSIE